jgi:antitoxin HicB
MSPRILSYTVVFEPAAEGGFVASVPLLPGCMSQGETFEEAKKNIQDAIRGYLDVLKKDGDDIPRESEERIVASVTAPEPV